MAHASYPNRNRHRRRNSHSLRNGQRGFAKTTFQICVIVLIPLVTVIGGGYLAYEYIKTEKIDVAFCYERNDRYEAAVFVDFSVTHLISPSQQRDLKNKLAQTFRKLPPNGRLSVFTTARDSTASINEPVFVLCNPPKNEREQERIDGPLKSTNVLKNENKDAGEKFADYIEKLANESKVQSKLAITSPLLEQVQGISRYDFGARLKKLIFISDGINNSPNGYFCTKKGELPSFRLFAQKPHYQFVKPDDLNGVSVDILLFESTLPTSELPYCTNLELRNFWISLFEENGANPVRLTPLGYGAG